MVTTHICEKSYEYGEDSSCVMLMERT